MIYHIMSCDDPVITIETDEKNRVVSYEKHIPDCPKQVFWGDHITTERLYNFLKDRCYEDSRPDLPDILEAHNMKTNNPYEWCRKTHGVTWEDFIWIKFEDEDIEWKDVRIR